MTALKQPSFAGGLLSSNVWGRTDLAKWQAGLAECRNFWINRFGNAENRSGTDYCGLTLDNASAKSRAIGFQVSNNLAYVLEVGYPEGGFGFGYIRPWVNGARLYVSNIPSTLTNVALVIAWDNTKTYANGEMVWGSGAHAYISLQDDNLNHLTTDTAWWMKLEDATVGGNNAGIVEIRVPSLTSLPAVMAFTYTQLNGELLFAVQSAAPFKLEYHSASWWRFDATVLDDALAPPFDLVVSGTAGPEVHKYGVVSIGVDGVTESQLAAASNWAAVVQVVNGNGGPGKYKVQYNNAIITWLVTGDIVQFDFNFLDLVKGRNYSITIVDATHFLINELTGDGASLVNTPGRMYPAFIYISSITPTTANPNTITWTAPADGSGTKYKIYEFYQGVWAFLGSTTGNTFADIGITPNPGFQPVVNIPMFQSPSDYPSVVGTFQQRLWFGNTINQPQSYWASRINSYGTFNVSTPVIDSDAFTFTLAGHLTQFITAFVDIGKLIILTTGGAFVANGNSAGGLTPTSQNLSQIDYAGSLPGVAPVTIGLTALFAQSRGTIVRDLRFDVQMFNYAGKDTSIFASSYFQNKTIQTMAWSQVPDSIVWVLFTDGTLLAMTYIREHDMWAWHRHDTINGTIESIVSVPENGVDTLYMIVNRTILGATQRSVERLRPRAYVDLTIDAVFTDCSTTYDGRNTAVNTMTLTTGAGWTPADTLTLTSSLNTFSAIDATYHNQILLQQFNAAGVLTDQVNCTIIAYTSAKIVKVQAQKTVPTWAQTGILTWGKAVSHFAGMTQLAGQTIAILGDGNVDPQTTVDNSGNFVTSRPYMIVHAGLPITAQVQTLDWENAQGETIANKRKDMMELTAIFVNSRGGTYGSNLSHMFTFEQRQYEPYDTANYLLTGPQRFPLQGTWAPTAQIWIQQTDPLPLCLAAIVPTGNIGG